MTPSEFEAWVEFYRLWPFDDRHRYHRPAALVAATTADSTVKLEDALDWLDRKPPTDSTFSEADQAMFRAAGIRPPRRE